MSARLIASNKDMNWSQVTEHSTELGARRMLHLGLLLASELLGAQLPQQVSSDVTSRPSRTRSCRGHHQTALRKRQQLAGILETAKLHIRMRERLSDRCRYVSSLLLNTTVGDWTSCEDTSVPFFLYYWSDPFGSQANTAVAYSEHADRCSSQTAPE